MNCRLRMMYIWKLRFSQKISKILLANKDFDIHCPIITFATTPWFFFSRKVGIIADLLHFSVHICNLLIFIWPYFPWSLVQFIVPSSRCQFMPINRIESNSFEYGFIKPNTKKILFNLNNRISYSRSLTNTNRI